MEVKLGINRVGGGSKPLGCAAAAILQLVEPSRVVPIVVPNTTAHTNPSHSLSFSYKSSVQFVHNNLGCRAVTNVTTPRQAAPNDCCLPVGPK